MTEKEFKGNSIVAFPSDYVVIDLETTGLSSDYNEIIEIAAIKVSNGNITTYSSLIKPNKEVDDFIADLTGITNKMLVNAPSIEEELPKFLEFVGNSILVGHNVSFDVNFIYTACENSNLPHFTNDFVDTLRIARRLLPQLKHHRLQDLVEHYNISYEGAHRALTDCQFTNQVYISLYNEIKEDKVEDFIKSFKPTKAHSRTGNGWARSENMVVQPISPDEIDKDNLLYGKNVCITGALEKMERKYAHQLIENCGGVPQEGVTANTNFLILGDNSYCKSITDSKSAKQKKAEALKLKGQDIEIIPESVFYDIAGLKN